MNWEHTASLLNSEYQVKISMQTILEHLLWFIACEGEGNETAATVNNSNIPNGQERGRSWGEGRSRKRFGDNEITNMTPIIQRSMHTTTLFEYIMADSIFGTKPATSSRAMGRLIDLFGKLNVLPNSNLPGLRFFVYCICIIMWHSRLNDMEIPDSKRSILRGFELGTTLS